MADIVVGYVPRPEGVAALHRAAEEARLRQLRLVVVNSARGGREFTAADAIESEAQIEKIASELDADGIEHDVRQLVRGMSPAEDILAVAADLDAELIVIGIRPRTPAGKALLGSNSQQVLLDARCPVLAVKASGT